MNFTRTLRAVGASAAVALAAVAMPAGAAELLDNGGFEDLGLATPEGWGGYTYYFDGTVDLPNWDVVEGSVDVTTNASPWRPAYEGTKSLDINGWTAGKMTQSFDTVAGETYTVFFAYSRNLASGADPALARVSAGGQFLDISALNDGTFGTVGNMKWLTTSFTFVGTGGTQDITIEALSEGNGGVFFDAVSVTGAVPEPATWALMIGGFGLAGATLRRRRAAIA